MELYPQIVLHYWRHQMVSGPASSMSVSHDDTYKSSNAMSAIIGKNDPIRGRSTRDDAVAQLSRRRPPLATLLSALN